MEDPTERVNCPDCNGSGRKILFDWDQLEEYDMGDECQLCCGSGEISEMDWGYYKKDKQDSINEDNKD